jgi:hypothetical protein
MRGELMQRTVTRQVRFCSGPDASRRPFGGAPASLKGGVEHPIRTSFLCVFHLRAHPGCGEHEVQVLGDFYGADEVACRLCLEEESS